MEPDNIQPDYSFIQNTQPASPVEPPKRKLNPLILIGGALLVVLLIIAAAVVLLDRDKQPESSTEIIEGTLSSQEAAPAISATESFINAMSDNDTDQASAFVSPASESGGMFNSRVAEGYFGAGLEWSGCRLKQAASYPAYSVEVASVGYNGVNLEYACKYDTGREVIVTFDMRSTKPANNDWKFYSATVRDEGLPADVI